MKTSFIRRHKEHDDIASIKQNTRILQILLF